MLIQPTLDTLNRLKLHGMALALSEQTTTQAAQGLAFEERLALLLEREELALEAVAGYSPCHYHLVLETWKEPGKRIFKSPFTRVLEASVAVGQFDLTEQYIHEEWFIPRNLGFAEDLGVKLAISPWQEDGMITVSLAE